MADYPYGDDKKLACSDPDYAGAVLRDSNRDNATIVICPPAFKYVSSFPIPGAPSWPGVKDLSCDTIGENMSMDMCMTGNVLLGLYLYWPHLMGDALKDYGGAAQDHAHGPRKVLDLPPEKARANSDSYVWFATELAWTLRCNRTFGLPM